MRTPRRVRASITYVASVVGKNMRITAQKQATLLTNNFELFLSLFVENYCDKYQQTMDHYENTTGAYEEAIAQKKRKV